MTMTLSSKGLLLIMEAEGFVDHIYKDSGWVPTIGFGHRVLNGETFAGAITRQEGLELLQKDVAWAELWVNSNVKVEMTQGQFDALVDFTFNCGIFITRKYVLPLLKTPEKVPVEMRLHAHDAKGHTLPGLDWRRDQDVNLWLDQPLETREEWKAKKNAQAA